jgi:hypothetical protein
MFEVKDSGQRQEYSTGMRRDLQEGKTKYSLICMPMLKRWAEHMTKGAVKYSPRNWEKASTAEELDRFLDSAFRHFIQWFNGEEDEDHASACWFNICGAEHVKSKLKDWTSDLATYRKEIQNENTNTDDSSDDDSDTANRNIPQSSTQLFDNRYTSGDYEYPVVGDVTRLLP